MSPEERQLLQGVFDRMRNNSSAPRDSEADRLITDNVRQQPYSPYFLTQAVIVQEQALQAASQRIQQLEQHIQAQPAQTSSSGGFLSSIFGGGATRPSVPAVAPPPVWNQGGATPGGAMPGGGGYNPGYQQQPQGGPWSGGAPAGGMMGGGMMGSGGGGFLHGALQTAAGVAGGALLFDGIKGLMGGHSSPFGIGDGMPGSGVGGGGIVNNYYGDSAGGSDVNAQQDANQDFDASQDASDYGVDDYSSDS